MYSLVGGEAAPWYFEGIAELMATHRWSDGRLTLNYFPRSRDEVPKLGRIEIVQNGYAARKAMSLARIFAYDSRTNLDNEMLRLVLGGRGLFRCHPRYQERFRQLPRAAATPDFAEQVTRLFADDWATVNEDWQLFVANLDYGYDFQRMNVEYAARRAATCRRRARDDRRRSRLAIERLRAGGRAEISSARHGGAIGWLKSRACGKASRGA